MNVAAASLPPASPVADGSTAAAGQAGDAAGGTAVGFDALLALVAQAAAPADGKPSADAGADADADGAANDAEAAPVDPMQAVLAAMMAPPPAPAPLADTTTPIDGEPLAPAIAPPAAAVAAATPDPAGVMPAIDPEAAVVAPDMKTATPASAPAAAPAPTELARVEATPAPPAPVTAPTPIAAQAAAAPAAAPAPTATAAKSEAPAKSATHADQPTAKTASAAAPAEAVKTETDQAVTAVAAPGDQGQASGSGSNPATVAASAEPAAPAAAPTATAAASTPADPIRMAEAAQPQAAPPPVRGSPETVAKLSADILKKLDGRSTRFELALDPAGLGRVDVKVEIGAHGHVTAALSFDTPQAAAELRSRAGELRSALQQAGFDLPENALSFDVGNQAGGDGRGAQTAWDFDGRGQGRGSAFAGRAFEAALNGAESLVADLSLRLGAPRADGVDIRI